MLTQPRSWHRHRRLACVGDRAPGARRL